MGPNIVAVVLDESGLMYKISYFLFEHVFWTFCPRLWKHFFRIQNYCRI